MAIVGIDKRYEIIWIAEREDLEMRFQAFPVV
jgi:hypothetical protein